MYTIDLCSMYVMLMVLNLYSAFLVLMTTQSSLQYSFYIHPFTHTFIQCIYYQHFVVLWGPIRCSASCPRTLRHVDLEDWGSNCRPSGWETTTLPLSHSRPTYEIGSVKFPPLSEPLHLLLITILQSLSESLSYKC